MKSKVNHILFLLLTAFPLVLFALSCNTVLEDKGPCDEISTGESYVAHFMFRTVDGSNNTKAVDENLEPGKDRENYLDRNLTHFLVFTNNAANSADNTFLAEITEEKIAPQDDSAYPVLWDLAAPISVPIKNEDGEVVGRGPLTVEQVASGFKIVVLANVPQSDWEGFKSNFETGYKLSELCADLTYTYTRFASLKDVCIPMYGVLNVAAGTAFFHNISTFVGHIDLLRAMTKIELVCSEEDDEITDAYITKAYNSKGKVCPTGIYDEVEKEGSKWSDKTITQHTLNIPSQTATTTNLQFYRKDSDGKTWVCYVPEFDNINAGDEAKSVISVKGIFNGEEEATYNVQMCEYDAQGHVSENPTYLNFVRNYYFQFNLKKNSSGNLVVKVDPWNRWTSQIATESSEGKYCFMAWGADETANDPWNVDGHSPNADYYASEAGMRELEYPQINSSLGKPVSAYYTRGGIKVDCYKSAARFSFKMTGPVGAIWTASLSNGIDFAFLTTDGSISGKHPVMQGIARDEAFEIAVVPTKELFVGDVYHSQDGTEQIVDENFRIKTQLFITVLYATSVGTANYLEINPEATTLYPFAGGEEDKYDVMITQRPIQANNN